MLIAKNCTGANKEKWEVVRSTLELLTLHCSHTVIQTRTTSFCHKFFQSHSSSIFFKMPSLPLPVSSIHLGALVTSVLEPSSHIANVISTPCFLTFTFHYISLCFVFAFIILHLTFKRKTVQNICEPGWAEGWPPSQPQCLSLSCLLMSLFMSHF